MLMLTAAAAATKRRKKMMARSASLLRPLVGRAGIPQKKNTRDDSDFTGVK